MHREHKRHDEKSHGHGEPYTVAEMEHFHTDDVRAGRAIVSLMLAVFSLGFVGSLTIAIICAA